MVEALRETLSHHGAAPMTSTALGFLPQGSLPSDAASLLSSAGHALGVRYEMRRPFARWLGAQVAELAADGSRADAVVNLRRYEVRVLLAGWGSGRVGKVGLDMVSITDRRLPSLTADRHGASPVQGARGPAPP